MRLVINRDTFRQQARQIVGACTGLLAALLTQTVAAQGVIVVPSPDPRAKELLFPIEQQRETRYGIPGEPCYAKAQAHGMIYEQSLKQLAELGSGNPEYVIKTTPKVTQNAERLKQELDKAAECAESRYGTKRK